VTKFKIGRKKKKDETASPSTPRLSIDAQTTTFDMEEMKKRKSHRYENYKDYLGHAHFNTSKTSLKIFYQEKLLQEKLVIDFCILQLRRFNSKTSKMSICV